MHGLLDCFCLGIGPEALNPKPQSACAADLQEPGRGVCQQSGGWLKPLALPPVKVPALLTCKSQAGVFANVKTHTVLSACFLPSGVVLSGEVQRERQVVRGDCLTDASRCIAEHPGKFFSESTLAPFTYRQSVWVHLLVEEWAVHTRDSWPWHRPYDAGADSVGGTMLSCAFTASSDPNRPASPGELSTHTHLPLLPAAPPQRPDGSHMFGGVRCLVLESDRVLLSGGADG